jgi:hypothetical protein
MSRSDVTVEGIRGASPGRDAIVGASAGAGGPAPGARPHTGRGRGGERAMVPEAEFSSYYGLPIINKPVWESPDIPGYLFLGGLAGASSVLAAGGQLTSRPMLARVCKHGAALGAALSLAALVHDLGRRERFLNMLRTFKPTSPMSVGSWLLAAYGPCAAAASLTELAGTAKPLGTLATIGAATIGPAVASYTAALVSDTAVPAWHEGFKEMPFAFVASATASAGGLGLLGSPLDEAGPARVAGALGGALELACVQVMEHRMGLVKEAFHEGKAKRYSRLAPAFTGAGVLGALLGRRSRLLSALSGAALMLGSACERWAIFEAGINSAEDPKYTVVPQRRRLDARSGVPTPAHRG